MIYTYYLKNKLFFEFKLLYMLVIKTSNLKMEKSAKTQMIDDQNCKGINSTMTSISAFHIGAFLTFKLYILFK